LGTGEGEFGEPPFGELSILVFIGGSAAFGAVSSFWISSEIGLATSAFTEIESMPCLIRNFTISSLEPACPQIEVSTPCFLHSLMTRDNCFRTAQFISSYMSWTSSLPRSMANVYWVRSFVPNEMKSIFCSQMSLIRIVAAGVSIMTPNFTLSIWSSLNIAFAFFTSSIEIICGNMIPNLWPSSASCLIARSSALKMSGCFSENRIPWSPSIGFASVSFGAPSRFEYSSLRMSELRTQIGLPMNLSAISFSPFVSIAWYSSSLFSFSYAIGCLPAVEIKPSNLISPIPSAFVFAARSANCGRSTMTLIFVFVSTTGRILTDLF